MAAVICTGKSPAIAVARACVIAETIAMFASLRFCRASWCCSAGKASPAINAMMATATSISNRVKPFAQGVSPASDIFRLASAASGPIRAIGKDIDLAMIAG